MEYSKSANPYIYKKRVWLMLKCKSFKIISLDSNKMEIKYNHWIENAQI